MQRISPVKAAFTVGFVLGAYQLAWVNLVLAGWAEPFLAFILRLHFIRISYEIAPFDFGAAGALVLATFALGAAFGAVFAAVWNWLSTEEEEMKRTDTPGAEGPVRGGRRTRKPH
jgi:hypothetical protein